MVYSPTLKISPWFLPLGLAIATVGNLVWMTLTRKLATSTEILYAGLIYDLVITFSIITAGSFYSAVELTWRSIVGLSCIVAGVILLKL